MTILAVLSGTTTGAPGTVAPTYVASGSTWNVVGGGGGGARAQVNSASAGGAGGGGLSQVVNVTWTQAQDCVIGGGGAGGSNDGGRGVAGTHKWVRICNQGPGSGPPPTTTVQGALAKSRPQGAART